MFSKPTARALAILDLLMANPQQAFGLTEMTRRLQLNKATCHSILSTMAQYGFLVQNPKSKSYRLGPSIVAAGNAAFAQFPVLEYARPELESLTSELQMGCGATGRTERHIVLLSHYGASNPLESPFQLGLRLPNIAPLGSCFIAWSPAKQLEAWLTRAHNSQEAYNERLDQKLRVNVISIRSRGFEVTLKTKAEEKLIGNLKAINDQWNLEALEECSNQYQQSLCHEQYHIDRIDPKAHYSICNISVPVFGYGQYPALTFSVGSIKPDLSGKEILDIAERLKNAASRVTQAARNSTQGLQVED